MGLRSAEDLGSHVGQASARKARVGRGGAARGPRSLVFRHLGHGDACPPLGHLGGCLFGNGEGGAAEGVVHRVLKSLAAGC